MRKQILLLGVLGLFICPTITNAQDFGLFNSVLTQLDSSDRSDFLSNLDTLLFTNLSDTTNNFDGVNFGNLGDSLALSGVTDSLTELLQGDDPFGHIDSLSSQWTHGADSLGNCLAAMGLDSFDIDSILDQYDIVNDIWDDRNSEMNELFDDHQNNFNLYGNISLEGSPPAGIDSLFDNLNGALDENPGVGLGGFGQVINDLFSSQLFTDLEIAYGRKNASVSYYRNDYESPLDRTQVIRVGSVPSFARLWEARWHFGISWTPEDVRLNTDVNDLNYDADGFVPLTYDADFAAMYNPGFSFSDQLSARVITSLGMEIGTYAPAHRDPSRPRTMNNQGNVTGYGPQVGTGFSTTYGALTSYALGTMSYGQVANCPDHNYRSYKFEAGARFGKSINLRYSVGKQNWAHLDNKEVNTRQQFTVGLLTSSLFNDK